MSANPSRFPAWLPSWIPQPQAIKRFLSEYPTQRTELLLILLRLLWPAILIILPIWIILNPTTPHLPYIALGILLLLSGVHLLVKTGHDHAAATLLVWSLLLTIDSLLLLPSIALSDRMLVLNFLITAVLLSSLLLTVRTTLIITGISLLTIASFFFLPTIPAKNNYAYLTFTFVTSALIIITSFLRHRYLSQIIQNESRYRALFEQTHDAVFILNLEGQHLAANHRAADLLGYTVAEIQTLSVRDLSAEPERSAQIRQKLLAGEHIPQYERLFRQKNGDLVPVEITVELVRDENGHPLHIQSVVRDISQRKQMEEALRQSETRYREVVENQTELICRFRLDTTITFVNPAYCQHFGRHSQELIGQSILQFIPPDYHQEMHQLIQTTIAKQPLPTHEHPAITATGETHWYAWVNRALTDANGRPTEIQAVGRDITERKQAQLALKESQERLRSIVESMREIVWSVTPTISHPIYINPVASEITGHPTAAFYENNWLWFKIAHPEDRPQIRQAGEQLVQHGSATWEFRIIRPDGHIRTLLNRAWTIRNAQNELIRIDGLSTDITEQKQAEQQAFTLALEQERVRLLTQFIQHTSHEFRTPLAIISANLYLLTRLTDPDARTRHAQQADEQIRRINRLLQMLLVMSRLDSGVTLNLTPVNLNAVMMDMAEGCTETAVTSGHTLTLSLQPDLPLIQADTEYLTEAIKQLLNNAFRYTPRGGTISLQTATHADWLLIEIADTGAGIDPTSLPHIFERFWRQDVAHTTPGFGLGLPIAQQVIKQHNGRIEVTSTPGQGSTFRIWLPLRAASEGQTPP